MREYKKLICISMILIKSTVSWVHPPLNKLIKVITTSQGVNWVKDTKPTIEQLKIYDEIKNSTIVYPEYYMKPIHSYSKGNLCWKSAIESNSANNAEMTNHFSNMTGEQASHFIRTKHINLLESYANTNIKRNNEREIKNILDIGCSTGISTQYLKDKFPNTEIIGMDLSANHLAIAKEKLSDNSIILKHGDCEKLPYENGSFDVVNIAYVLHELPRDVSSKMILECNRILRHGGILSILDMSPSIQPSNALLKFILEKTEPYLEEYIYWSSNAKEILKNAGFVSYEEINNIPKTNIKLCWKSLSPPVKINEVKGDFDKFIERRKDQVSINRTLMLMSASSITTIFFQLVIAFVYADIIRTLWDKFVN